MLESAYGHQWYGPLKDEKLKSVMNWTLECIKQSDYLTIFDIRRETQMDKKILSALLKGHDMSFTSSALLINGLGSSGFSRRKDICTKRKFR